MIQRLACFGRCSPRRTQGTQVIDVRGIGVQHAGEGLRLVVVALVCLVEDIVEVGHFVEVFRGV